MGDMLARLTDGREVESAIAFEEDYDEMLANDSPGARVQDALDALAPANTDPWRRNARAAIEMRWGLQGDRRRARRVARAGPQVGRARREILPRVAAARGSPARCVITVRQITRSLLC